MRTMIFLPFRRISETTPPHDAPRRILSPCAERLRVERLHGPENLRVYPSFRLGNLQAAVRDPDQAAGDLAAEHAELEGV